MQKDYLQFEQRKQDHIDLSLLDRNQANENHAFDRLIFQHDALPDLNFDDLDITSVRFGKPVTTPFLVSSMTAGHKGASSINRHLMEACEMSGWAMGVGSQRRELTDEHARVEWHALRNDFPSVTLFSNIGIAQLLTNPISNIHNIIESIQARALIIHCNPLQEVIQPEGTPQFKGCWQALETLVNSLSIPVIVKETGCGFSLVTLKRLHEIGVAAVDVSGLGGTHWGRIEGCRAGKNSIQSKAAETFRHWGIDTLQSVKQAVSINPCYEVWGSGGVRHGLDAAKLLALGATTVGFAKPMLEAAIQTVDQVHELMKCIEYELKIAMFCTGSRRISELKEKICL